MFPFFQLRCPSCGKGEPIREERFLSDPEPTRFIVCRHCQWEALEAHGVQAAQLKGREVHEAEQATLLATRRAADARANAERAEQERQQRIALVENTVRTWAGSPVGNRVVRAGEGWKVRPPDLAPGVALDRDLDEGVRSVYAAAVAEAEGEARRRDVEDAEKLVKARVEQAKRDADQAKRDAEARRQRRDEKSDTFVDEWVRT